MRVTTESIEKLNAGSVRPDRLATLVAVRETRSGAWRVVLGFGGELGNPLVCGRFASKAIARAAAPRLAQRYTSRERVTARRHRAECLCRQAANERHSLADCPLSSAAVWRWAGGEASNAGSNAQQVPQPLRRAA